MTSTPKASYAFTKLVVNDLEAMAEYYREVYGLTEIDRVKADIGGTPIEEIMLAIDGERASLILLAYAGKASPIDEVIVGFTTSDIEALFARATAAGGRVVEAPKESVIPGLVVGFVTDPEGHLAEVVER